mgnify:CR=1 FL=1
MAGHSKWKQIKRKKAVADARRGQLFTRLAREIAIAAREGGGSTDSNFKLRLAVEHQRTVRPSTVLDVLAMAGGLNDFADSDGIVVMRQDAAAARQIIWFPAWRGCPAAGEPRH